MNYLLVAVDVVWASHRVIRQTESPNVTFFHRQPYYLLRTGMLTNSWTVRHFEGDRKPLSVDLSGISIDNALLLYWNIPEDCIGGKHLYILRKGDGTRSEIKQDVVIIEDPDLDMNCTAYVDPDRKFIYVALSNLSSIMIINTCPFSIQYVTLLFENRIINLDIRYAFRGELIFAKVPQTGTELLVGQLEEKYWKTPGDLEAELKKALEELDVAKEEEAIAREELAVALRQNEDTNLAKEKRKTLGQDLSAANGKIGQLRKEVGSVKQQLESEKRKTIQKVNAEQHKAVAKEREHQRELQRVKTEAYTIAAQYQRLASEDGFAKIQEERDRLASEKAELEKKYRRMLLLFGRQPGINQAESTSLCTESQKAVARIDQKHSENIEKCEAKSLPQLKDAKKNRKK